MESGKCTLTKNKKNDPAAENQDIRTFFNTAPSSNKRIMNLIKPYLNEINNTNYKLRERKIVNYKHKFEPSDSDNDEKNKEDGSENFIANLKKNKKRKRSEKQTKKILKDEDDEDEEGDGFIHDNGDSKSESDVDNDNDSDVDYIELRDGKQFNKLKCEANKTIIDAELEIKHLEKEFYVYEDKISEYKSRYPDHCVPICADIREFKFKVLAEKQKEITGQLFDVIMMDPPWQLSSSQPTRGVAIAYDTLNDNIITDIPVDKLQTDGFICIWTINAKFKVTLDLIKNWGYR